MFYITKFLREKGLLLNLLENNVDISPKKMNTKL